MAIGGITQAQTSHQFQTKPGFDRSVEVPLLYEKPKRGSFHLEYELGQPFDRGKPTVLVVVDGQQFYVRKGLIAPLQDELFGPQFNVVGIFGRGTNEAIKSRIGTGSRTDWPKAYELLKSYEWIEDIESLRKDLLGVAGVVSLY